MGSQFAALRAQLVVSVQVEKPGRRAMGPREVPSSCGSITTEPPVTQRKRVCSAYAR
jgi:hypothetical protein